MLSSSVSAHPPWLQPAFESDQPISCVACAKASGPTLPPQQMMTTLIPTYSLQFLMKQAIAMAAAPSTGLPSSLAMPSIADAISVSEAVTHSFTSLAHGPKVMEFLSTPPAIYYTLTKHRNVATCIHSVRATQPLLCTVDVQASVTYKSICLTCSSV